MYLKSIEIQGFKSFANRLLFEFHNGITGIVGPNGSGKSNVADAVRWVLGEQRVRQLRGGSMQDVIFAGTEMRKPQGFAYVAITLDNSDHKLPISYDEVTISRRLYRSGESEYKINGSSCRLKDINELFYDTGIGKEGYSIIGQGQIDRILSGKPEERRELFDEAAGIVKFKRRKAIAQKKLEDEQQNLVRVRDILSELEKQVGPLERQSAAAKEYLRLRDSLKKYDANLFLAEAEAIRSQREELKEREAVVAGDLEAVKAEAAGIKEEYESLLASLSALEAQMAADRGEAGRLGLLKESLEGRIGVLREQINTERMNEEHIKSRMASIDGEAAAKSAQKAAYMAEKEALSCELAKTDQKLKELEASAAALDQAIAETQGRMEEAKAAIIASLNDKAGLAAQKQRYETMLEQADLRRAQASQKLLKFRSDESVEEVRIREERTVLDGILARLSSLASQEKELSEKERASQGEEKRLNQRLNYMQQEYHTSATRLESLRNLAERYDGYGGSIRRVMEVRDRIFGIHGVVADIISTTREYETAIETALGGSIQNIVTDSEQTAKRLIEYLKKNRYGRATFLPLGSMAERAPFRETAALGEPGVLGLASDLVTADPQYRALIGYLLGRVVVVDQIDHAIALARKYRYALRIVTLDGELFNPGGSMTGGAFKNSSNLLGRKREIEELQETCKKALISVEQVQKDIAANEALLEETQKALAGVREESQKARLEQNTCELNIRRLEGKKQEIREASADLAAENETLNAQVHELKEQTGRLSGEEARLEALSAEQDRLAARESARLESLTAGREKAAGALSDAQLEASGVRQKAEFIEENIRRVEEEALKLLQEKETLSRGQDTSGQAIAGKESEIASLKEQIEEAAGAAGALAASLEAREKEKEEKTRRQKTFFDQQEELTSRQNLLDRDLFRIQGQKEKLDERLEREVNYMWSEYELSYTGAEQLRDADLTSVPEMKKAAQGFKEAIRALGNVNVNAIEDYKEISGRFEFMKSQHDDLVASEAAVERIIEELDSGMRRQFDEKFREISREFDKVFKELFGGGHGVLELLEDEDILEAGVQIISQPPGKKLQNMMQLSGGEKALTAIALLFAIQNLKPSPFCLLDEIEAALDDSNVDRFAGYLHKLTRYTQFIVITHRRGTMVSSDRLYGITMQEKGVSTLVSVSLIEDELT